MRYCYLLLCFCRYKDNYLGIGGEGIAIVHRGIVIMMSVHMVAAVLVAEVMIEIAATMIVDHDNFLGFKIKIKIYDNLT